MARDLSARLTYEDYVELPNDGKRYEIHDGELSVTPAPGTRHQGVSIRLASLLFSHVSAQGLREVYGAPVDVILDRHTIVQPYRLRGRREARHRYRARYRGSAHAGGRDPVGLDDARRPGHEVPRLRALRIPHDWLVDPDAHGRG